MPVSGNVSQAYPGNQLTFTDTSTGLSVTSRNLVIKDANGTTLQTINMGNNLTATYNITKDVYLSFILTLNGTQSATVNFMSTMFYDVQALAVNSELTCGCSSKTCDTAMKAEYAKQRAITYYGFGQAVNAQKLMDAANTLIDSVQPCNC